MTASFAVETWNHLWSLSGTREGGEDPSVPTDAAVAVPGAAHRALTNSYSLVCSAFDSHLHSDFSSPPLKAPCCSSAVSTVQGTPASETHTPALSIRAGVWQTPEHAYKAVFVPARLPAKHFIPVFFVRCLRPHLP